MDITFSYGMSQMSQEGYQGGVNDGNARCFPKVDSLEAGARKEYTRATTTKQDMFDTYSEEDDDDGDIEQEEK